jgi:phosphohistidine phosphatase SixA
VRIVLFRHGIAIDRADPACPAEEHRPLTDLGRTRTRAAARGLSALDLHPGRILSSPWSRARQTAEIAASELDFGAERIEFTTALLPFATPSSILQELTPMIGGEVLLTGHAPHLDALLEELAGSSSAGVTRLKKAGAAAIEVSAGRGRLEWMISPRELRRLGDG